MRLMLKRNEREMTGVRNRKATTTRASSATLPRPMSDLHVRHPTTVPLTVPRVFDAIPYEA